MVLGCLGATKSPQDLKGEEADGHCRGQSSVGKEGEHHCSRGHVTDGALPVAHESTLPLGTDDALIFEHLEYCGVRVAPRHAVNVADAVRVAADYAAFYEHASQGLRLEREKKQNKTRKGTAPAFFAR